MAKINLKQLAKQLDAAQAILDEIRVTSGCEEFVETQPDPAKRAASALAAAEKSQHARRLRPEFIGCSDVFGETGWDILIDLFIRHGRGEEVSVVAPNWESDQIVSTTLRWLLLMEDHGVICFEENLADSRQAVVRLRPAFYEAMTRYFEAIAQ